MVKIFSVERPTFGAIWLISTIMVSLAGCQTVSNDAEPAVQPKRDLLINEARSVRDAHQETKDQFLATLQGLGTLIDRAGVEARTHYEAFSDELKKSESIALALRERIVKLEERGRIYFERWESSLTGFAESGGDQAGRTKFNVMHRRYEDMLSAMKRAEQGIDPMLTVFRDQLLFVKYNLNAEAIARLQDELPSIEADTTALIGELEASIAEADTFIRAMRPRLFGIGA